MTGTVDAEDHRRHPSQSRRAKIATAKRKTVGATKTVLKVVEKTLDDDKAADPVVIDLAGRTPIADYMVVASGLSARHVQAMAEHLVEKLKEKGLKSIRVEGVAQGDWVLIDGGDVPTVSSGYWLSASSSIRRASAAFRSIATAEIALPISSPRCTRASFASKCIISCMVVLLNPETRPRHRRRLEMPHMRRR